MGQILPQKIHKMQQKKVEQVATLTAGTPVQSLDPATAVDQTSITLLANVMEGLYRLDEKINRNQPLQLVNQKYRIMAKLIPL